MKRSSTRSFLLIVALLATLAATGWTYWRQHAEPDPPAAMPVRQVKANSTDRPAAPPAPLQAPARKADAIVDLFAVVDWSPPAPAPVAPAQPPAPAQPTAPPLPFEYVGRTQVAVQGSPLLVHLRRGQDLYSVGEGTAIDDQYRLDKIDRDSLEITYLPLSVTQTLVIGMK